MKFKSKRSTSSNARNLRVWSWNEFREYQERINKRKENDIKKIRK
jgi:hypothetical protein